MTVEASIDPLRFDVVPGVAVVASVEHAVSFVVGGVCLVAEGDHYGAVVDVVHCPPCDQYPRW